jgi:hypothetical protein
MPTPPPNLDRINHVNIGLMLGSAALACLLPFEAFLGAYAVLGPLHYLTQISWLHDRGYFTTGRWDWVPLALLGVLSLEAAYGNWLGWSGASIAALGLGIATAFVRHPAVKVATFVVCVALTAPLYAWLPARLFFGVLLTTVIHVYVFTGLFILAGSIRSGSRSGYASFAVFVACGLGLLLVQPATAYEPTAFATANMGAFMPVVDVLDRMLPGDGRQALVATGRFLGFAYTYHYLNWFSKTGVIRWHEISRARMAGIGTLWLASVGLYTYDYATGLAALFFLSVVHVFLEFPLDARTLAEVMTMRRRPVAVAAAPLRTARRRALRA